MPDPKKPKAAPSKPSVIAKIEKEIADIEKRTEETVKELAGACGTDLAYGLTTSIYADAVDDAFDVLRGNDGAKSLTVMVDSPGGDIHAAYNLANLFRRCGMERLVFVVPRWAKSAATLLACAGDLILMTPVAELGPLDPQLTDMDRQAGRHEHFSPLHIESTLELIRREFEKGRPELAEALVKRLQFPMTLGSYRKLLDVGQEYAKKLLSSRMLKGDDDSVDRIAKQLATGYPDHGYCINLAEAVALGLKADATKGACLDVSWQISRLTRARQEAEERRAEEEMKESLQGLPPELVEKLRFSEQAES